MLYLLPLIAIALLLVGIVVWLAMQLREMRRRYAPVIEVEREVENVRRHLASLEREQRERADRERRALHEELSRARNAAEMAVKDAEVRAIEAQSKITVLNVEYATAKALFDRLRHEISLLEETSEDISVGLYRPHYQFRTSDDYKAKLEDVNRRQKQMVRDSEAAKCALDWTINGSKKEGARMQKQYIKLMLRAFNGESDAAVAKVTWNNVTRMEERLRKAFESINALGVTMNIEITRDYFDLRMAELRLEHELAQKREEEAEEQRRIREQIREEEKAERELEKAKDEAEQEELRFSRALEKARAEAAKASGGAIDALNEKVRALEDSLREAHERRERAISRAQMTKSGHVYVISNIGSFGERVLKIGMTRRLDPFERVRELGDASVPFSFDVHAMAFAEDAPALENEMHRFFAERRLNLVNPRKEFFNVTVDDIAEFARQRNVKLHVTKVAEAKEYRETMARRSEVAHSMPASQGLPTFPERAVSTGSGATRAHVDRVPQSAAP